MIKHIHKIPDRVFFNSIFLIVVLLNLKYFFLPFQVLYTMFAIPFIEKNAFYSSVQNVKVATTSIIDFQDEGKIGFISDVPETSVFDLPESVKDYYISQYAIVPSILRNDIEEKYVLGRYFKSINIPDGFSVVKEISPNSFILKKDN